MNARIRPEVEEIKDRLIETRRDIHRHPELAYEEHRTAGLIAARLKELGIGFREGVGRTGVVGTIVGSAPGRTIALRADMDALPLLETSGAPYSSTIPGVSHACGHDGHVAMLLAAAEVLQKNRARLSGTVRLLFQPAEEGAGGARLMIDEGCLDGVDEVYGLHLWNYQPYGEIGNAAGPVFAATDEFQIRIKGKGGHGAMPQGTVDAVVVASHLILQLQTITSRNIDPLESGVVTVGKIAGGSNFNIIAETVELIGTARSYQPAVQELIIRRMQEIVEGTARAFGAEIHLDYKKGYPPTINAEGPAQKVARSAAKIVGSGVTNPYLTMGGEDFSYFLQKVPGCYFFVGSCPPGREPLSIPHHCPHFDFDERALLVGASVFVQLAEDELMK